jgi:hypothetical protein
LYRRRGLIVMVPRCLCIGAKTLPGQAKNALQRHREPSRKRRALSVAQPGSHCFATRSHPATQSVHFSTP